MNDITLRHVCKSYTTQSTDIMIDHAQPPTRTRQVLRDVNVTFPLGKLTVLVGRSGCGKSTLLRLLSGQDQPDSGEIGIPEGWHSAVLSPDPYVITWTSVLRNVAMACGVGRTPEERLQLSEDFVEMVGLGLARVLAGQAELLLMDEPFAALDFLTRAELQSQLLQIQARMPRTIVLVTHQLDEAILLAQKIVVMHSDSSLWECSLADNAYPRDVDEPQMRELKRRITEECRK